MVFPKCDKSLRVRYVRKGVPEEADLACSELPEGIKKDGESLNIFTQKALRHALKLDHNDNKLTDIQILGFNN